MTLEFLKGPLDERQYQDIRYYDRGGMGEIYLANDINTNSQIAIKVIRVDDKNLEDLLNEEFQIALSLNHENIIKSYYYGEFSDATGRYFYNVMEFSKNGNLRKKLSNTSTPISIDDAVQYFYDLSNGLKEAHKKIIHRDIKPENILISNSNKLQICDFGIAKYVDSLTRTKTFKGWGSFPYMSPECWVGDSNTKSMDIYSLGIVFFEILTLKKPFTGISEAEIRNQHLFEPLPSIIDNRQDAPILISELIRKMTNKNVNNRFQRIEEVVEALDNSFQIKETERNRIQSVLLKVDRKFNTIKEAELKKEREREQYVREQNWLQYAINELFESFIGTINQVNQSLIEEKIYYNKSGGTNAEGSRLNISLFEKRIVISFQNKNLVSEFILNRKEAGVQNQIRLYGMVINVSGDSHIQRDNVLLVGKIDTNCGVGNRTFSANLILRKKNAEDIYGEWWLCKFEDTVGYHNAVPRIYYGIDPMEFFSEYEIGRSNAMHNKHMKFKKIDESDIVDLIEKLAE